MEIVLECILDAVHDTWTMIPLLYAAYLVLEYYERKDSQDDTIFFWLQKYGPLFGALLGLLPQCGFSILAAMLFVQNYITLGTVIAVFAATSDEAIPVLISEPKLIPSLLLLLCFKFITAIAAGYFCDRVLFPKQRILSFEEVEEEDGEEEFQEEFNEGNTSSCPCCYPQYPMWLSALLRTMKIFFFVFLTTFLLNLLIELIGADTLSVILLKDSVFQPVLAALFGFIPNCAATVVLCQLYAAGQLSFASLLAGLVTNAGLGLVCLLQYGASRKNILRVILILFAAALIAAAGASILQMVFPNLSLL